MSLLEGQSKVIRSLQNTIEGLNITIKSLNEKIEKMEEKDISKDVNKNSENVHSKTVHEKTKVSNISSHKTPVQEDVEKIWDAIESNPATEVTVDLEAKNVRVSGSVYPFEIDDYTRWRLMEGLDDIGLTLKNIDDVTAFEKKRPSFKPLTLPAKI